MSLKEVVFDGFVVQRNVHVYFMATGYKSAGVGGYEERGLHLNKPYKTQGVMELKLRHAFASRSSMESIDGVSCCCSLADPLIGSAKEKFERRRNQKGSYTYYIEDPYINPYMLKLLPNFLVGASTSAIRPFVFWHLEKNPPL